MLTAIPITVMSTEVEIQRAGVQKSSGQGNFGGFTNSQYFKLCRTDGVQVPKAAAAWG